MSTEKTMAGSRPDDDDLDDNPDPAHRHTAHPPEHYVDLRQRRKNAGIVEKRFKVLASDLPAVTTAMTKFTERAKEALWGLNVQREPVRQSLRAARRAAKRRAPSDGKPGA